MASGEDEIYYQGRLTFILSPERIVVKTSLSQMFFLDPTAHYWNRRLTMIRTMIKLGEIRDLNELSIWCHHGGIQWVPTDNATQKKELMVS